ncbi:hypothetical protein DYD21_02225 [Rhodohalobacter sp. SW132]|uniref:hypothetical protein n=1 Tax=Rhodohalobacter sp. SW132 TaxID=2293433 RepID=UPI000E2884EB|nr:hypothetical protein [Rhodohalobacter sp. SW132]REL38790.1 hypothetical protein DYD21_02225 [Rhodohalobacter sp. SW132]
MIFWEADISAGRFFLDFAWLGLLLVAGLLLRNRISLFRRYLIPANLIGGALGLVLAGNGLGWIDLTSERLGIYVYHLLALLFIGLSLRAPRKKIGLSSVKTGILFICTYLVQGIIGLIIAFLLIFTIMPDLFAGIGLLSPLAFGMNPGIAYTIGQNWQAYGFESGGIVGLTFAAIGFLCAYTTGVWMVKNGIRKDQAAYIDKESSEKLQKSDPASLKKDSADAGRLTSHSGILESLSLHIGLIGGTYLLTYGCMKIFEAGLVFLGAENEASTLWSFHFVFAAIIALAVRRFIDVTGQSILVDDITMTRISNLFMDLMIAASIAAISLAVVGMYWFPLLLISISVIAATWWMIRRLCNSLFADFQLERTVAIYGNMTGTLQSGLLLLRILDERMQSPVSYNLVYGSGLALLLGFPLLLLINAPVHYFSDVSTGFGMVLLAMAAYLVLLLTALYYLNGEK